jgi:hypothetical protein
MSVQKVSDAMLADTGTMPAWDGSNLTGLTGGGPSLGADSVIRTNATTISENINFVGNENGMSVGPITVASGFTVTVTDGSTWIVVE